jgi:hypothetical protein
MLEWILSDGENLLFVDDIVTHAWFAP